MLSEGSIYANGAGKLYQLGQDITAQIFVIKPWQRRLDSHPWWFWKRSMSRHKTLLSSINWDGKERWDIVSQWCTSVPLLVGKQGIVLDADPTLFDWALGLFVLTNCSTMAGLFFPGGSAQCDWPPIPGLPQGSLLPVDCQYFWLDHWCRLVPYQIGCFWLDHQCYKLMHERQGVYDLIVPHCNYTPNPWGDRCANTL